MPKRTKLQPVAVDVDADLPPTALARLDKIAAMTKLSREQVFAVLVAAGIVDEALDQGGCRALERSSPGGSAARTATSSPSRRMQGAGWSTRDGA